MKWNIIPYCNDCKVTKVFNEASGDVVDFVDFAEFHKRLSLNSQVECLGVSPNVILRSCTYSRSTYHSGDQRYHRQEGAVGWYESTSRRWWIGLWDFYCESLHCIIPADVILKECFDRSYQVNSRSFGNCLVHYLLRTTKVSRGYLYFIDFLTHTILHLDADSLSLQRYPKPQGPSNSVKIFQYGLNNCCSTIIECRESEIWENQNQYGLI